MFPAPGPLPHSPESAMFSDRVQNLARFVQRLWKELPESRYPHRPQPPCDRWLPEWHRESPHRGYFLFVLSFNSSSTASCLLDQMKTSCPFSASITARAVPQLPEPMTVTFFISCDLQSYFFKSQFPKRIYFLEPNLFSVPFKSFLIFPLCRQNAIALTKIVR